MMWRRKGIALFVGTLWLASASCRQDMHDQARVDPFEENPLAREDTANLMPPSGTIARGELRENTLLYEGIENGKSATKLPFALTQEVMERGRQRYEIFCAPCHGLAGQGDGPVAQRGFFPHVENLHEKRLRVASLGYLFAIVSNGFNAMPPYAAQIPVHDRWAIVAYVRALQFSQNAALDRIPQPLRRKLEGIK